jgi:transcriptional regulator with XRE-family HTH domain
MENTESDNWYSEETATFGDRLAGARDVSGLTQAAFARKIGVAERTVQAWEEDRSEPRANRLQMMSGMLNVSIRWLLTGEGEGLDAPVPEGVLTGDMRDILSELSQMRTRALALSNDMGQLEKRLRKLMRENAA